MKAEQAFISCRLQHPLARKAEVIAGAVWLLIVAMVLFAFVYDFLPKKVWYLGTFALSALVVILTMVFLLVSRELLRFVKSWLFWLPMLYFIWTFLGLAVQRFRCADPTYLMALVMMAGLFWIACATRLVMERWQVHFIRLIALAGLIQVLWGIWQAVQIGGRPWGTCGNSNKYGSVLALSLPLWAGWWAWERVSQGGWKRGVFITAGVGLYLVGLILSGSRGAWGGFLIGALVALGACASGLRWKKILFALIVVALGATLWSGLFVYRYYQRSILVFLRWQSNNGSREVLAGNAVANRVDRITYDADGNGTVDARDLVLNARRSGDKGNARPEFLSLYSAGKMDKRLRDMWSGQDSSIFLRLLAVAGCTLMWLDYPVFGVGPGNYRVMAPDYLIYSDVATLTHHAHSLPVLMLAEQGLPGFLVWPSLVLTITLVLRRRCQRLQRFSSPNFFLAWAILAALFHNLLDITIPFKPLLCIFPLLTALYLANPGWQREG